jgi:hypothetical protein
MNWIVVGEIFANAIIDAIRSADLFMSNKWWWFFKQHIINIRKQIRNYVFKINGDGWKVCATLYFLTNWES